ncbi:MAG: hypothetical protein U0263_36320 [Polyangiaceae bacterium]
MVLSGAYLGEVLRDASRGKWLAADQAHLEPASYALAIGPGVLARPIDHALARITASGLSFHEYAERMLDRTR